MDPTSEKSNSLPSLVIGENMPEEEKRRYEFFAREVYQNQKEYHALAVRGSHEYGKWLIATLLLVPGGAFIAIFQSPDSKLYLAAGGAWLALSLGFAIVTGFCVWLNYQALVSLALKWHDYRMLLDKESWQRIYDEIVDSKRDPIGATYFLSVAFGLVSFYCLAAAAAELLKIASL